MMINQPSNGDVIYKERLVHPAVLIIIYALLYIQVLIYWCLLDYNYIYLISVTVVYIIAGVLSYYAIPRMEYGSNGIMLISPFVTQPKFIPKDNVKSVAIIKFSPLRHFTWSSKGRGELAGVRRFGGRHTGWGILVTTGDGPDYLIIVNDPKATLDMLRQSYPVDDNIRVIK